MDGRIETFTHQDGLTGDSISALLEDTNGDIWIGTHTGLSRWHGGKFEIPDKALQSAFIFDLAQDHEGNIWAATLHDGLLRSAQNGTFSLVDDGVRTNITSNPRCLLVDDRGRVWAGLREKTLLCYDHGKITRFGTKEGFPEIIVNQLLQTQDGTIWAGSLNSGLYYYRGGRFNVLLKKDGLPDSSILSLYTGREHLLWIGTQSGGLARLGPKKFSVYHVMDGASECVLRSLAQTTNGDLWVGTYGQGIYHWQGSRFESLAGEPDVNTHPLVEAAFGASDGSLWWGAGPRIYCLRDDELVYSFGDHWLTGDRIWCLGERPDGAIWIGTFNGQLKLWRHGKFTSAGDFGGKPITSLAQQPDGTLWVGTLGNGLFRLQDGRVTNFTATNGLSSDLIRCLSLDADKTLWIGTDGGGLVRLAGGQFSHFNTRQGLIDDTVLQILSDDDNCLWLGYDQGICRISKREVEDEAKGRAQVLHPLVIGVAEGLVAEQCIGNFNAALKLADGRLCFSTVKGIAVIDPRKQLARLTLPLVLMQNILMDDKPLLPSGAKQDGLPVYEAAKGEHVFQFFYTGLNYDEPERIQFRYQLEGYDLRPVDAGTERSARYNYLAPGTYRFRVFASNSNAVWTQTGSGSVLIVPAYWWQTDLFKVLFTLFCLVLVALVVRSAVERRYRAQVKRLEQENAMENERTRIARDLHDELGSSLTYISMAVNDLTQKSGDDAEKFQQRQKKVSTFANRTARSLDEIVWAINPGNDSLRSLLAYLMQFAREHYEDSGVSCRFQIADDLPELPLPPEMRHNIFLAVKEALNNALKYSRATEVHLIAKLTGSQVEICVRDNGTGFDLPAMLATSERNGLTNMRKRVEKLGGKFSIETAPGKGTAIRLTVNCTTGRPVR